MFYYMKKMYKIINLKFIIIHFCFIWKKIMELSIEVWLAWKPARRRRRRAGACSRHAITLHWTPRELHAVCRPPPHYFSYYNLVNLSDVKHSYSEAYIEYRGRGIIASKQVFAYLRKITLFVAFIIQCLRWTIARMAPFTGIVPKIECSIPSCTSAFGFFCFWTSSIVLSVNSLNSLLRVIAFIQCTMHTWGGLFL